MTPLKFILAILILSFSCTENTESKSTQTEAISNFDSLAYRPQTLLDKALIDTVLEKNDPNSLDLSKHQIFIDTTRNSTFYQNVKQWSESKWDKQSISFYLNEINKDFKPIRIDLKGFPTHFISLRKLNDQFVLYDRCDGIDPRFELRDSAFIFYGPLESYAASISQLTSLTKNLLDLELRTFNENLNGQKSRLKIEKIEEFIFQMTYSNQIFKNIEYLTTLDGINNFDLVVNNCPTMKVVEFKGFDNKEN